MRIQAHDLGWGIGGRPILHGVDLDLPAGQVTGLIGPNGSGKTTLLHLLAGLRAPTSGTVRVGGRELSDMRTRDRARLMALVEQDASTGLDLTVRQVVELGRIPHRGRWAAGTARDREIVDQALLTTRVDHLAERPWQGLSGGERQRTHLARAIAQRPGVLVLDEPTNHLDIAHQWDFLGRVRALRVTTVAALHDLELAAAHCDQLVVLAEGRLVTAGPVDEVLTDRLIADVYGVAAAVVPHPDRPRLHVRVDGVFEAGRRSR